MQAASFRFHPNQKKAQQAKLSKKFEELKSLPDVSGSEGLNVDSMYYEDPVVEQKSLPELSPVPVTKQIAPQKKLVSFSSPPEPTEGFTEGEYSETEDTTEETHITPPALDETPEEIGVWSLKEPKKAMNGGGFYSQTKTIEMRGTGYVRPEVLPTRFVQSYKTRQMQKFTASTASAPNSEMAPPDFIAAPTTLTTPSQSRMKYMEEARLKQKAKAEADQRRQREQEAYLAKMS